jgi:RNA polymerase subunit RPABC4/transcription elongation factor Spt4
LDDWDDDLRDDDDEPTITCPYCRREIHEDSVQCPHCGQYISEEDAPAGWKPWWIIIGALLSLLAVWVWIANGR